MKKSVVDIYDLQEMVPFFKGRVGTWLGKLLIKCLRVDLVNKVHARNCHLRGAEFTSALLHDPIIDLSYEVHNKEILDHLPEGAFVTVSNHPIGSLDGIMLIDIFASRRPDFKVMVNGILTKIGAMEDNFISVVPDSHKRGANPANVNGVRLSLQRLKEGHPMGFFPAGAISFYNKKEKQVRDLSWAHSVIRLVRKAKAPVPCVFLQRLSISVERKRMYISVSLSCRKRSPPSRKTRILPSSCINVHMVLKNKKRSIESVINSGSLN